MGHPTEGGFRIGDPLQGPRGCHHIEASVIVERGRVSLLEAKVGTGHAVGACTFQQPAVPIDTDNDAVETNRISNVFGDGAGAAADVQHRHSR